MNNVSPGGAGSGSRTRRFAVGVLLGLLVGGLVILVFLMARDTATLDVPLAALTPATSTTPPTAQSTTTSLATTTSLPPTTTTSTTTSLTTTTTTLPVRAAGTVPVWTVGQEWGSVEGITMFRGNPTRTYYGRGPAPEAPEIAWRYPSSAMCGLSTHHGEPKTWCGTGWTGQPLIWVRPDGVTEIIFGSYDKSVHFIDAATGEQTRSRFKVGDIVKGSPSILMGFRCSTSGRGTTS